MLVNRGRHNQTLHPLITATSSNAIEQKAITRGGEIRCSGANFSKARSGQCILRDHNAIFFALVLCQGTLVRLPGVG